MNFQGHDLAVERSAIAVRLLDRTKMTASAGGRPDGKLACSPGEVSVRGEEEIQLAVSFVCPERISWIEIAHTCAGLLKEPCSTMATIAGAERAISHRFGAAQPVLRDRVAAPAADRRWWWVAGTAAALAVIAARGFRLRAARGRGGRNEPRADRPL
jgi:hypothetical protein